MVAQSLQGPWLNFEEVTHKTGLVKNEILYAIQTHKITPVIYTNNRAFLAYSKNQHSQTIGHAHFQYSGTLAIDQEAIQDIVTSDRTILSREPVKLLCPEHIKIVSSRYPYRDQLPNALLNTWEPSTQLFNDDVTIIMQPFEYQDYEDAESGIVDYIPSYYDEDAFFADYGERYLLQSKGSDYVYSSNYNHVYDQKDLRFPLSAVNQLINPKKPPQPISPQVRKRYHDINEVLERVIKTHPTERSGTLWNALRRDIQSVDRTYDCDNIIQTINHHAIDWVSAKGTQRQLKKASFQTAVSRLKRRIA